MSKRYICIHGHFYQPPRENPWLEEVELQDSAQPFHDWNERITAECYGPNATARILDEQNRILNIVNNYAHISFNFGPTLLSWLERKQPEVYERIIDADAMSQERFGGHGSAIAQVYNHMIMPLAGERDRRTQVLWGIEDFRNRFGRDPEGMWLPETAVDLQSLDILVDHGIKFTILAPNQASRVRPIGGKEWTDVSGDRIDPTRPYLCKLPSGRTITLFVYDGPISRALAFEDLLSSGENMKNRLMASFLDKEDRDWDQLVHIATDGETYGHHHSGGEMALAWALHLIEQDDSVELVNYGQYLEKHEPEYEIDIFENSAWSCAHGVERWTSDCGCNSGMHPGWHQRWRAPLREAVNWLAERSAEIYEENASEYLKDPWRARDKYINVILDRSQDSVSDFLNQHATKSLDPQETIMVLKLLELSRYSQLIFTSCGWFFDEISGIETVQIIQYAVRTIQLAEEISGRFLEEEFVSLLGEADSNILDSGAEVYERYAKPAKVDMLRVGAHYAISSLFEEYPEKFSFAAYEVVSRMHNRITTGRSRLVTGRARVTSVITQAHVELSFAVLHPGDHNISAGVDFFKDLESFREMESHLAKTFERGDITDSIRYMDEHFGRNIFSIWHLFRDEQRKIVDEVLAPSYEAAESAYRQIYDANYTILNFLEWLNVPLPHEFVDAARHVVGNDLRALFRQEEIDFERLETLIGETKKWNLNLHFEKIGYHAAQWINSRLVELAENPDDLKLLEDTVRTVGFLRDLPMGLHLWRAQNAYFSLWTDIFEDKQAKADEGVVDAARWVSLFTQLGETLKVLRS